jgi:hypothetical protein
VIPGFANLDPNCPSEWLIYKLPLFFPTNFFVNLRKVTECLFQIKHYLLGNNTTGSQASDDYLVGHVYAVGFAVALDT